MSLLSQIFGGPRGGGSRIPIVNLALLGLLGYRTLKGKGRLAEMFNINRQAGPGGPGAAAAPGGQAGSGLGDMFRGGLGALFGGGVGSALGGGLRDLIGQFQQKGAGETADSWVSSGPNRRISAQELEQALGTETVDDLATQAGVPRHQLLQDLSEKLPEVVDKLTPEGRLPTEEEAERWAADEPGSDGRPREEQRAPRASD